MWLFVIIKAVNKTQNTKENFGYNHDVNILKIFYSWESFPFITSEMKHDY